MDDLNSGNLRIECAGEAGDIVLTWRGSANDRNPAVTVNPFVRRVYDVAAERKASVEMRFEKLEHFNSSAITTLIQLIQEARTRKLRLVLTYDGSVKWQRL